MHYAALSEAESKAKAGKKNIWESYVEKVEEKPEEKLSAEDSQLEEQHVPEKKYKAVRRPFLTSVMQESCIAPSIWVINLVSNKSPFQIHFVHVNPHIILKNSQQAQ